MAVRRGRRIQQVGVILTLGLAGVVVMAVCWRPRPGYETPLSDSNSPSAIAGRPASPTTSETSVRPESESPFLNTRTTARFVGSQACRECHESEHTTYHLTGMSRATADVDLSREPPDATFDHVASKRRFAVVRRDGQMWHRESLLHDGPEEIVLAEYPVRYVVGSGRHSLTYLVEEDGFLMESPITWYTTDKAWGMSPGYDRANHQSFEREVGESCLICHVGRVETVGRSMHRANILEGPISCEQCHGPGSLHIERHAASGRRDNTAEVDYTIVNPKHLSRSLTEAICQQCHLQSAASVIRRGTQLSDFRPGEPMEKYRANFRLSAPGAKMTVVGHSEQMRLSRCYEASADFSCLTCHNPHSASLPDRPAYNAICQQCHSSEKCGAPIEVRRERDPADDCVGCHMPKTDTNIPHLAFTHHRVGIHDPESLKVVEAADVEDPSVTLVPFDDLSTLSPIERRRAEGLAYVEAAHRSTKPAQAASFLRRALPLLMDQSSQEPPDGTVLAALAQLRADTGASDAEYFAKRALKDPALAGQERCNAIFLLADADFRAGRYESALVHLRELHTLRRHSLQWLLQAECEKRLGRLDNARESLLRAVHIDPELTSVHRYLAEDFRQRGDEVRAEFHARRAR